MNPRIRSAYDNCVEKEASKAAGVMQKAKDCIVPITLLTIGAAIPFMPGVAEGAVKTAQIVMSMPETISALKANHAGIFYGLSAGLTSIGALIAATGYLERKQDDPQKQQRQQELLRSTHKSWENIVKTDDRICVKVARHQQFLAEALAANNNKTNLVLRQNGIDPSDRHKLLDLQRAYVFGVKNACVEADKEGRTVNLSPSVFDQFTAKRIAKGMATYYQATMDKFPSITPDANLRELVESGLSAIRDIQLSAQYAHIKDPRSPEVDNRFSGARPGRF